MYYCNNIMSSQAPAPAIEPMYAKIAKNIYVGNYDSLYELRTAMKMYENGTDSEIAEITAALNVSAVPFNNNQDPIPQTRYIRIGLPGGEPMEPDFPHILEKYKDTMNIVKSALQNGNIVMLICESGRSQAVVLAAMTIISTGVPVSSAIEVLEFAYMTKREKEEYKRIQQLRETNKYVEGYELDMRDNRIFSRLTEEKLCLSPQLKKMLVYYAGSARK